MRAQVKFFLIELKINKSLNLWDVHIYTFESSVCIQFFYDCLLSSLIQIVPCMHLLSISTRSGQLYTRESIKKNRLSAQSITSHLLFFSFLVFSFILLWWYCGAALRGIYFVKVSIWDWDWTRGSQIQVYKNDISSYIFL